MRKRPKTTKKSEKKAARKSRPATPLIIAAIAIIAIGAVTVISKVREGASTQAKKTPVTNAANRSFTTVKATAQDTQVSSPSTQAQELTPEEAQRMAEALKQRLNKSTEGLMQEQQPDGSVTMELNGRLQSATIAKINEDGSISQSCVDNPKAGAAFLGIDPQLVGSKPDGGKVRQQTRVRPTRN